MSNYKPVLYDCCWTIGKKCAEDAIDISDGVCAQYWWDSKEDAKKAADALNAYEGAYPPKKGETLSLFDQMKLADDFETKELYELFNAIDDVDDLSLDSLCFELGKIESDQGCNSGLLTYDEWEDWKPAEGVTQDMIRTELLTWII